MFSCDITAWTWYFQVRSYMRMLRGAHFSLIFTLIRVSTKKNDMVDRNVARAPLKSLWPLLFIEPPPDSTPPVFFSTFTTAATSAISFAWSTTVMSRA